MAEISDVVGDIVAPSCEGARVRANAPDVLANLAADSSTFGLAYEKRNEAGQVMPAHHVDQALPGRILKASLHQIDDRLLHLRMPLENGSISASHVHLKHQDATQSQHRWVNLLLMTSCVFGPL